MEIDDTNYTTESSDSLESTEPELSHSDKLAGIFSEPAATFESMAKHPIKTIDWFLPILILFIALAIANIILISNPVTGADLKQKQMEKIQKNMDDAVKSGKMTQAQADEQVSGIEEKMNMKSPIIMIVTFISTLLFGFIFFFILAGIYYFFCKFVLKGDGTYLSALAANGLVAYIGLIQVLITTILALILGRVLGDTSVASFMNMDKTTFVGMLLSKLDVISIWSMIILSIGLSRLNHSKETLKYAYVVFGLWIAWSLFVYFGAKAVPFIGMFQR